MQTHISVVLLSVLVLAKIDSAAARAGANPCAGAAQCQGDCLTALTDQVTTSCCPDPAACPNNAPTECNRHCGRKFSRLFNLCNEEVDLSALSAFHDKCEAVVTADQTAQDAGKQTAHYLLVEI